MRRPTLLCLLVLVAGSLLYADKKLDMSIKDYKKLRQESGKKEAYERAAKRLEGVLPGMRTDQFMEQMEMMMVRDKSGKPMDGFVEGYMHDESREMNEKSKGPDRYLVFGYYEKWKDRKGGVKMFYVVFRNKILVEINHF